MPNEHEPLPDSATLSAAKIAWIESECKPGRMRLTVFLNVVTTTLLPTDESQTIVDGYVRRCKLHDREPELIVERLQSKAPNFFEGVPTRGNLPLPLVGKKALVGDLLRHYIGGGRRKYGKPGLRSKEEQDLEEVS